MKHEYEIVEHPHLEYLNIFLVNMTYRRLHLHREFEICMVLAGEMTVRTTKRSLTIRKDDVILLNPRQAHAFHGMTENTLVLSIQVTPRFCEKIYPAIRFVEFEELWISDPAYAGKELDFLRKILYDLAICYHRKDRNYEFFCMSYVYYIFGMIFNQYPWHTISERQKMNAYQQGKRLERILEYVDAHYMEKLLLTEIAEKENLTVTYISHFFKDNLGMTFQQYVNFLRFEQARKMVEQTALSITEISMMCGFSDYRYLNKIYKEQLGYLPSDYRNSHNIEMLQAKPEDLVNEQTFLDEKDSLDILYISFERYKERHVL